MVILGTLKTVISALVAALALAPTAQAGGPTMLVGAAEDLVKQPDLVGAKANMALLRLAGFDSVRVTVIWAPGQRRVERKDVVALENVAAAAGLHGVRVLVSVYHFGSRTTPLTDEAQSDFAAFTASIAREVPTVREFIIGNEPNINRFWLPQFNEDGSNAAAPAYMTLLARTYDALKEVSPRITVIGGALSPRGSDRPGTPRDTHSPTKFIRDLGAAYRATGRDRPIMDQFAIHPYGENSSIPPSFEHPRSTTIAIADYGKLVALLGEAFDGTAQPGSELDILYAEYGIESQIPADKASLYTGTEPDTIRPVDEATQAAYYRQAIGIAFCQPTVRGIMIFHVVDEPGRPQWQSGLYYVDRTAKSSIRAVTTAAAEVRRGIVSRCDGLQLTPRATAFTWPTRMLRSSSSVGFKLRCDIDCTFTARLERMPGRRAVVRKVGTLRGNRLVAVKLPSRRLAPGRYRISLRLVAAVNPGPPALAASRLIAVR
jgi:hypothetical protein